MTDIARVAPADYPRHRADFRKSTDPVAYGDAFGAFKVYFDTGIDGIFTDNPDTGLLAHEDYVNP